MNNSNVWVSKCLEAKAFKNIHPFLVSLLLFGCPQLILIFVIQKIIGKISLVSIRSFYSLSLVLIWIALGPYLIWIYDKKLLPSFFKKIEEIFGENETAKKLNIKYNNMFAKKYYYFCFIWAIFFIIGFFFAGDYFLSLEIKSYSVVHYLILINVIWVGILAGIGFFGVFVTLKAINETSKKFTVLNPFHQDGVGGLNRFGSLAIGTTLLFATGSLFIPVIIDVISSISTNTFVFYVLGILYVLAIALSFFVPIYIVNKKASRIRNNYLRKVGEELLNLIGKNSEELLYQFKILNLRSLYFDYKNVKLYPIELDTTLKLIFSLILPIIIILFEHYIFKL